MKAHMLASLLLPFLLGSAHSAAPDKKLRAVVLPPELGGFWMDRSLWRHDYELAISNRLASAHFTVLHGKPFTATETACHEVACLVEIATARGASLIVSSRLTNDEKRLTSYALEIHVVELSASGEAPISRLRKKTCVNCTEVSSRDALATLLSTALVDELEGETQVPNVTIVQPPEDHPHTPPDEIAPPDGKAIGPDRDLAAQVPIRLRLIEGGLALAGAIGIAGIAIGIPLIADAGNPACVPIPSAGRCPNRLATRDPGIGFVTAGGLLAVGAAAGIALIEWKLVGPSRRIIVTPIAGPSGVGLSIGGAL